MIVIDNHELFRFIGCSPSILCTESFWIIISFRNLFGNQKNGVYCWIRNKFMHQYQLIIQQINIVCIRMLLWSKFPEATVQRIKKYGAKVSGGYECNILLFIFFVQNFVLLLTEYRSFNGIERKNIFQKLKFQKRKKEKKSIFRHFSVNGSVSTWFFPFIQVTRCSAYAYQTIQNWKMFLCKNEWGVYVDFFFGFATWTNVPAFKKCDDFPNSLDWW